MGRVVSVLKINREYSWIIFEMSFGGGEHEEYIFACSAGMSTSLLAAKMEEAVKSKEIVVTIWVFSQDKAPMTWKRHMSY
ncbi:hypothetical protein [Planococcus soli]|uniref:hypothetical protein n=1 Tax=Planococcus soli TaxID=2666072 RepID=UPI002E2C63EA|nr:hypothetical protein [Planococcus soli]